jgi:glutamate dehydrogenase (NAD(P)+)
MVVQTKPTDLPQAETLEPQDTESLFAMAVASINRACDVLKAPEYVKAILGQPKNEIIVNFPVQMDNGRYKIFKGYRIQHNNILGPYKGGMRFHPEMSLDDGKALATWMTMKCAVMRLPYGGGKGGVKVNARELSNNELMRLTRRFTSALGDIIGPETDIPAPDVGTNSQIMDWMMDTYLNTHEGMARQNLRHVVTGKSIACGGSEGREKATGQGIVYVLQELLPEFFIRIEGMRFSVLGYGNVASNAAVILQELGAKLVAVMDHSGGFRTIHADGVIDAEDLAKWVAAHGSIKGYLAEHPTLETADRETFYRTPVDVFIPAALERMVDKQVAQWLNCRVVAEGGNGPCTPEADALLAYRNIAVLPAILCNAGGVTVSYFEWVQNKAGVRWELKKVDRELKQTIVNAARRVRLAAQKYSIDMGTASYVVAVDYVVKAYLNRGIFP